MRGLLGLRLNRICIRMLVRWFYRLCMSCIHRLSGNIVRIERCTFDSQLRFRSSRRCTRREEAAFGLQNMSSKYQLRLCMFCSSFDKRRMFEFVGFWIYRQGIQARITRRICSKFSFNCLRISSIVRYQHRCIRRKKHRKPGMFG